MLIHMQDCPFRNENISNVRAMRTPGAVYGVSAPTRMCRGQYTGYVINMMMIYNNLGCRFELS